MKKACCWIISVLCVLSVLACVTGGEEKLSPMEYEMSEALGIEDPDEYWTKDWREVDKNKDGYVTREEMVEAYPVHGLDAFPYYDKDGDGQIHWREWKGFVESSKRK